MPFPDPQSFRILLADLADDEIRDRLRAVWLDPLSLEPARRRAKVTREIARGWPSSPSCWKRPARSEDVAQFLMRCLFTMFAEDVELIPARPSRPAQQPRDPRISSRRRGPVADDEHGRFLRHSARRCSASTAACSTTTRPCRSRATSSNCSSRPPRPIGPTSSRPSSAPCWNGPRSGRAAQAGGPLHAAGLCRAAGAADGHRAAAGGMGGGPGGGGRHARQGDAKRRTAESAFHEQLCKTRVLDPACGSGNFLYVTLEQLKRLKAKCSPRSESIAEQQML